MKKYITILIFLISLFTIISVSKADIMLYLPNGNTYGLNESVLVSGKVYNEANVSDVNVSLYYNNGTSTFYWSSTLTDSNGNFNFTWYNETENNFTLIVNYTNSTNQTTVELIEPINVTFLGPDTWYIDSRGEYRSYYTDTLKITSHSNINNTDIENEYNQGYLQSFYINDIAGSYGNCSNQMSNNSICYSTTRYLNIPEGSQLLKYKITVYYNNGNYFEKEYTHGITVESTYTLIKNIKIKEDSYSFTHSMTHDSGSDGSCSGCSGNTVDYYGYESDDSVAKTYNLTSHQQAIIVLSTSGGNLRTSFCWYINGGSRNCGLISSVCDNYAGQRAPVSLVFYSNGNVTNVTSYISWLRELNYISHSPTINIKTFYINDSQVIKFPEFRVSSYSEYSYNFNIDTSLYYYGLLIQTENQLSEKCADHYHSYTYFNGNKIFTYTWLYAREYYFDDIGMKTYYSYQPIQSTNTIKITTEDVSVNQKYTYFVAMPKDLDIQCYYNYTDPTNHRPATYEPNLIWTNEVYNISCYVTNIGENVLHNGIVDFSYLPGIELLDESNTFDTISPNETKTVWFLVKVKDIDSLRGFGLDSMWFVANTTDGGFGFTVLNYRLLPTKHVEVNMTIPDRVQAGGLFSSHVSFKSLDHSIMYPHVMLDLDGTFGYEVGVSSANIGGGYTSGRCYDITIWYSGYEPGGSGHYTTTDAGTTVFSDSLNLVPQHKYFIYDEYGFLNKDRGNNSYEIGDILTGYGIIEPGDWKMYATYDYMINGFSAEAGTIYSDWNLGQQFLYKFLDITEVPQSLNIISGPDYGVVRGQTTTPATQYYNWIAWYPKSFPVYIYYSNGNLYWRGFPVSPYTYWVPCLSDGYSPLVPPFNVYILYIKSGNSAFSVPAGQRLAVLDNQIVEPGQTSEGVDFKSIAPLQPGIYTVTAIVWDDAETGLYWTATKQIRVISSLPGSGIIVSQKDEPLESVVADKPENNPKVLMKRIVYVTNKEGFDDYQVRWSANNLPGDAIYVNGSMEGTIDFLENGETVNPSNITYYLPGVVVTTSQINYTSQILPEGNATGVITLYAYNNASTQKYYNVVVHVNDFIPSGWSVIGDTTWIISSIDPKQNISKAFYLSSNNPVVTCELVNRTTLSVSPGRNIDWSETVKCHNPSTHYLYFSYPYKIPSTATNIKLNGTSVNLQYGQYTYISIDGDLNPNEDKYYLITYSTPPLTIETTPPIYPESFYVGQYARLIQYVNVRNWGENNISYTSEDIPIRYGINLTVYLNSKPIDYVDLVQGYYTLNITNITSYETRKYTITYYTPTATAEIKRYFRRVINKTQYIVYPVKITSTSGYPLSPLYITFEQENPFKCSDVGFIIVSDENSYLSPPNTGEKLSFRCSNNYTIVKLKDLPTGQSEYIDVFVIEEQPSPVTPFYKPIHDFFDWLYSIIKSFIEWITSFAR